jgi:hypothetical protein
MTKTHQKRLNINFGRAEGELSLFTSKAGRMIGKP